MEQHEPLEHPEHPDGHVVSIWFFIGIVLVVYGLLILGAGIYGLIVPASRPVVLGNLHAGVWWGAILLLLGVAYVLKFFPKRSKK